MNVKYVVLRNDLDEEGMGHKIRVKNSRLKGAIENQEGLSLARTFGDLSFYVNKWWSPSIYASWKAISVLGNISAIARMTYFEEMKLNPMPLFFVEQLKDDDRTEILRRSEMLIVYKGAAELLKKLEKITPDIRVLYLIDPPNSFGAFTSLREDIYVPRQGLYRLAVRLIEGYQSNQGRSLWAQIDNSSVMKANLEDNSVWIHFPPAYLQEGNCSLMLTSRFVAWHVATLYSVNRSEEVREVFRDVRDPPAICFSKINPTEFAVHVEAQEPFILLLTESFSPNWKAFVGNVEQHHLVGNSYANAYLIESKGNITLVYVSQSFLVMGLSISAIVVVTILICLLEPWKRYRFVARILGRVWMW